MTTTDETPTETRTVKLYNANDGIVGRTGGPYLDEEEMEAAEIRRAKVEGREPDLDNPGSTAGVHLVPAHLLAPHHNQVGTHFDDVAVDGLFREENAPRVFSEVEARIPGGSNVDLPPAPGEDSPSMTAEDLALRAKADDSTRAEKKEEEKTEDPVLDSTTTTTAKSTSTKASAKSS